MVITQNQWRVILVNPYPNFGSDRETLSIKANYTCQSFAGYVELKEPFALMKIIQNKHSIRAKQTLEQTLVGA